MSKLKHTVKPRSIKLSKAVIEMRLMIENGTPPNTVLDKTPLNKADYIEDHQPVPKKKPRKKAKIEVEVEVEADDDEV